MPNTQPVPPVYRIVINLDGNRAETQYAWKVTPWDSDETLWHGWTETRWGAERQARRAVKKLRRGKKPKAPRTYPEEIYVYP